MYSNKSELLSLPNFHKAAFIDCLPGDMNPNGANNLSVLKTKGKIMQLGNCNYSPEKKV